MIVDFPRLLCRLLWKMAEMFEYTKNERRYLCICSQRKKTFAQRFYLIYWRTNEGSIQFTREHGQLTYKFAYICSKWQFHYSTHISSVNCCVGIHILSQGYLCITYVCRTSVEKLFMPHTISAVKLSANNNSFPQVLEHSEGIFASDETAPLTTTPICPHKSTMLHCK